MLCFVFNLNQYRIIELFSNDVHENKKSAFFKLIHEFLFLAWLHLLELPEDVEEVKFVNGIMVLPIHLTKGLEVDTVLLFNPSKESYPSNNASAKLLYVAVTRALHEFRIVCMDEVSGLLA